MSVNGRNRKTVITLGMKDEIILCGYGYTEPEIEEIIKFIHSIAYTELMTRSIDQIWAWSNRTSNVFSRNKLETVKNVIELDIKDVDRLTGCGVKTMAEVYEVFLLYGIKLENWKPNNYVSEYGQMRSMRNHDG